MTKIPRIYSKSKTYHIILKGIDNQNIFYDDNDRKNFLKKILITKKEFNYQVYAYCLMDNHVHMVTRCEKSFLSKSMQSLMIRYVHYFNKKYKRTGTLVQNRFKSKNIENQKYFLEVCKYIHRNPENAGMGKTENYKWSSYKEYLGKEKIIDKGVLLYYLNNDINEFIKYTAQDNIYENLSELAEYEMIRKLTDGEINSILMKMFEIGNVNEIPYYFKNLKREELVKCVERMKMIKGTNKTQLARIIRISRYIIEKIWET